MKDAAPYGVRLCPVKQHCLALQRDPASLPSPMEGPQICTGTFKPPAWKNSLAIVKPTLCQMWGCVGPSVTTALGIPMAGTERWMEGLEIVVGAQCHLFSHQ